MRAGLRGRTGLTSLYNLYSWHFGRGIDKREEKKWSDHVEIFKLGLWD